MDDRVEAVLAEKREDSLAVADIEIVMREMLRGPLQPRKIPASYLPAARKIRGAYCYPRR